MPRTLAHNLLSPANRIAFCGMLVLLVLLSASGCVRRRMTVRSDPPGARVYIDDYDVGVTPCSTYYTYYGTRTIRLVKDGYETIHVKQDFKPPWYEYPGVDFFSENAYPYEIRDQRVLDFQLQPQRVVPTDELLQRAEGVRQGVNKDLVIPLPNLPNGTGELPPPVGTTPPMLPPSAVPLLQPSLGPP